MAFTYDLSTSTGKIRFTIGDTVSSSALCTDAEIEYCYTSKPSIRGAAIMALRFILAKFKVDMDRSANGFSSSRSQRFQQVKDLLAELDNGEDMCATATFTGASETTEGLLADDTDYIKPDFGEDDNENGEGDAEDEGE